MILAQCRLHDRLRMDINGKATTVELVGWEGESEHAPTLAVLQPLNVDHRGVQTFRLPLGARCSTEHIVPAS